MISKRGLFLSFFILIILSLLINIIGIIFIDSVALYIVIGNSLISSIFLILLFLFRRVIKVTEDSKDVYDNKIQFIEIINEYDELTKNCISSIKQIKSFYDCFWNGSIKKTHKKINAPLLYLSKKEDANDYMNILKYYKQAYKNLGNSIDFNKMNKVIEIKSMITSIVLDVFYKIPYFNKFLDSVKFQNEKSILNLIEKFTTVSKANSEASRDAEKNIQFLKNVYMGKSIEQIAIDSKEAFEKTKTIINSLISLNQINRNKLDKIYIWIKEIKGMLNNIQEISEQNKVIAINSSIEAARIGEAGKGFRVLAREIHTLNQKTSHFTREINEIMASFEKYNNEFINKWDSETKNIIYMKDMQAKEEKIINKFVSIFELTIKSLHSLSESTLEVDDNLETILESLQFEDITGQQLLHIKEFLSDIYKNIKNYDNSFKTLKINIDEIDTETDKKIKEELSKKISVMNEKHILGE